MANWSNPTLTSSYTNFLSEVKARDDDAATQFSVGTPTNMPTGAIKWDTGLNRWQKWSGSAWGELATTYALTGVTCTSFSNTGNTTLGDSSADTVTSNAASWTFANSTTIAGTLAFSGAVSFNGNVTLGDAAGDTVTVTAGTVALNATGVTFSTGVANFTAGLQVGGSNVLTAASAATLTNKVFDGNDGTNTLKVNGNTIVGTAGTGTITIPAATGTVVLKDTTDTLTNKTLTSPVLTTPTFSGGYAVPITNGGTGGTDKATARSNLGVWRGLATLSGTTLTDRFSPNFSITRSAQGVFVVTLDTPAASANDWSAIMTCSNMSTDANEHIMAIEQYDLKTASSTTFHVREAASFGLRDVNWLNVDVYVNA